MGHPEEHDAHGLREAKIGELWERGQISVAEEHIATEISLRVLALQREAQRVARSKNSLVSRWTRVWVLNQTGSTATASGSISRCSQSHSVADPPLMPVHGQWWP
jgi:hypothetical protein